MELVTRLCISLGMCLTVFTYVRVLTYYKGQSKVVLVIKNHALEVYRRGGGNAKRILKLGTRWRCWISFTLRELNPQIKRLQYSLDMTLGEPQIRSGIGSEENIATPNSENRIQNVQPIASTSSLCCL
jgi:hypothetical protein